MAAITSLLATTSLLAQNKRICCTAPETRTLKGVSRAVFLWKLGRGVYRLPVFLGFLSIPEASKTASAIVFLLLLLHRLYPHHVLSLTLPPPRMRTLQWLVRWDNPGQSPHLRFWRSVPLATADSRDSDVAVFEGLRYSAYHRAEG